MNFTHRFFEFCKNKELITTALNNINTIRHGDDRGYNYKDECGDEDNPD